MLLYIKNFARIQYIIGVKGFFNRPHHFQLIGISEFLHQLFAFITNAMLTAQAAAVRVNKAVQLLLVGFDSGIPVRIILLLLLQDIQMDITVTGMTGNACYQLIFIG